jgi:two-component system response regulator HydG
MADRGAADDIVGHSKKMSAVHELIQAVGPTHATVLVRGESGTGKELVARAIHRRSCRADKPFYAVNCSAFSDGVLDAELFGHVKGAFTGAVAGRKGLFEAADGGTVFLDEIGDISPATQVRLLRVLQEGEVKPVGANDVIHVDVRIIAATNVDLSAAIKRKTFREDLFYRLNVVTIEVPTLKDRPEDIMVLAHHFLAKHARRMNKNVTAFSPESARALSAHDWPGNVRELENAIARGVVFATESTIEPWHLPQGTGSIATLGHADTTAAGHLPYTQAKKIALTAFERSYLGAQLKAANGNISKAARAAGVDRSNFKRLLREFGVACEISAEGAALESCV